MTTRLSRGWCGSNRAPVEGYNFPSASKLWDDGQTLTKCLGCQQCVWSDSCGGLRVEAAVFDCMTYCRCSDPATGDNVCPRNSEHQVARLHEVGGVKLSGVAPAPSFAAPAFPPMVPMIYHSAARSRAPRSGCVALSLYEMFDKKDGSLRFTSRRALLDHFKLAESTAIILSGTDHDPSIERWWKLERREAVTRGLASLGVTLVTAPNYSAPQR